MSIRRKFKTCGHCNSSVDVKAEFCPFCFYDIFGREIKPINHIEDAILYELNDKFKFLDVFEYGWKSRIWRYIEESFFKQNIKYRYETFNIKKENLKEINNSSEDLCCSKCFSPLSTHNFCAVCGNKEKFSSKTIKLKLYYLRKLEWFEISYNNENEPDKDYYPYELSEFYRSIDGEIIATNKELNIGDYILYNGYYRKIEEINSVFIEADYLKYFIESTNNTVVEDETIIKATSLNEIPYKYRNCGTVVSVSFEENSYKKYSYVLISNGFLIKENKNLIIVKGYGEPKKIYIHSINYCEYLDDEISKSLFLISEDEAEVVDL